MNNSSLCLLYQYIHKIKINGNIEDSREFNRSTIYKDVKMYAASPWSSKTVEGKIRNILITDGNSETSETSIRNTFVNEMEMDPEKEDMNRIDLKQIHYIDGYKETAAGFVGIRSNK